jgi:hypothetical protein
LNILLYFSNPCYDVTTFAAPVLIRADGVIKLLSIAKGFPKEYASAEADAVCRYRTRFNDALPITWPLAMMRRAQYVASGRLRLQEYIPESAIEGLHKWTLPRLT